MSVVVGRFISEVEGLLRRSGLLQVVWSYPLFTGGRSLVVGRTFELEGPFIVLWTVVLTRCFFSCLFLWSVTGAIVGGGFSLGVLLFVIVARPLWSTVPAAAVA